mmetsp:Transcript_18567/g.46028  ORF Transcript_18567/g.46028 Transcript_18567/m.46028 type:complete len:201 (-) Transcript_18567:511-1113(-)
MKLRNRYTKRRCFGRPPTRLRVPQARIPKRTTLGVPSSKSNRQPSPASPNGFEGVPFVHEEYCASANDSFAPFHTLPYSRANLQFLGQKVGVLLEWKRKKGILLPEFGTEVSVGVTKGVKDGLDKVTHGTGVTSTGRVAIGDTGHAHKLLSGGRGNKSGTARGRNQTNRNGTTLSGDLAGDGVGKTGSTSPVSSSDGNNI